MIDVGEEPGIHLGHAAEQSLLIVGKRIPRAGFVQRGERDAVRPLSRLVRAQGIDRRQFGVLGNQAELLLPRQGLLAERLVAHVESTGVAVGPFFRGMVRRVRGAGGVVEEEGLVWGDRFRVADELHRLVRDIHGEVVSLLR